MIYNFKLSRVICSYKYVLFFLLLVIINTAQGKKISDPLSPIRVLISQGKTDSAFIQLNQFLDKNPKHLEALKFRAVFVANFKNDIELVKKDIASFLLIDPHSSQNLTVLVGIISIYLSANKTNDAKALLDIYLPKYNNSAELLFLSGNVYIQLNNKKEAIKQLEKSIQINPKYKEALILCFDLYFSEFHVEKAHAVLKKLVEFYSNDPDVIKRKNEFSSGVNWKIEHLKAFFAMNKITMIIEKIDTYYFCFIDNQAKQDHDWIKIIFFNSSFDAKEYVEGFTENMEEEYAKLVYLWGDIVFESGCGNNKNCQKAFNELNSLFDKLKEF